MTVHSKRGPSKAKQFRNCSGTFAVCDTIPDELKLGHGDAARLGTATHAIVEHCLKKGKEPSEMEGRIVVVMEVPGGDGSSILKDGAKLPKRTADHFPFIVDEDMVEDATVATDYVRARCAELSVEESDLELETRTNPLPKRDDTSGTADITIRAEDVLEVADYKNGYLEVEHKDNDQARAYLLGKAIEDDFKHETYVATIIQPNCHHADGAVRSESYTAADLKQFQKEYAASIKKCEEAEASFTDIEDKAWRKKYLKAGDWCTFCEAGATCPTRREAAEDLARIEFRDPPEELKLPIVAPSNSMTAASTEEEVARILSWAPMLDGLVRAAELYAHRAMENGYDIPGFKLVARRSNRKLIEGTAKEIASAIIDKGYVAKSDAPKLFTVPKLKSGPQIEKLVPAKKRKAFNKDFLEKPDNGTTIAPIDDPRTRVEVNVADEFESLEAPEEFNFG